MGARGGPMRYSDRPPRPTLALLVSFVPKMRPGEQKRNVAVGLFYLLLLWVLTAQALSTV